uniref:Uncharacterized protein n=1 Tax=Rhipicephalus pulchellus TaxID=72859 RepID=L7M2Z4_RHIPC
MRKESIQTRKRKPKGKSTPDGKGPPGPENLCTSTKVEKDEPLALHVTFGRCEEDYASPAPSHGPRISEPKGTEEEEALQRLASCSSTRSPSSTSSRSSLSILPIQDSKGPWNAYDDYEGTSHSDGGTDKNSDPARITDLA